MKNIAKLLATAIVTAGFAFGIWCLPGSCWPCCSFIAWFFCLAVIWDGSDKESDKNKDEEGEAI